MTTKRIAKHRVKEDAKSRLEGEGSYSGARAYNKATRDFVAAGKVPGAAMDAWRALDSQEAPDLAAAEARGKAGDPKGFDLKSDRRRRSK